jgi:hypothetical protein
MQHTKPKSRLTIKNLERTYGVRGQKSSNALDKIAANMARAIEREQRAEERRRREALNDSETV